MDIDDEENKKNTHTAAHRIDTEFLEKEIATATESSTSNGSSCSCSCSSIGGDDNTTTSICSSDVALCDVLGLASLTEMVMDEEDEEQDEECNASSCIESDKQYPCPDNISDDSCSTNNNKSNKNGITAAATTTAAAATTTTTAIPGNTKTAIPIPVPRRIALPATSGVSRKGYLPEDCLAFEIPDVLSRDECLELISVAARSHLPQQPLLLSNCNSSSNSSSNATVSAAGDIAGGEDSSSSSSSSSSEALSSEAFRYITHAVHTAPDGHTKFKVELDRPNPHKLAVFRHQSWVDTLWDRLRPLLLLLSVSPSSSAASSFSSSSSSSRDDNSPNTNTKNLLPDALREFVRRESLAAPPVGLNPRLRVLKYDASDRDEFRGHFDATTEVHPAVATASTTTTTPTTTPTTTRSQTSYLTVLLYLNDGGGDCFEGGETEFLSQHHHLHRHDRSGDNGHGSSSGGGSTMVTPRAGSIVVFEHDLFHRGRPLAWGTKYVLRTDVLFEDRACDPGDGDDDSDDPSLPPPRPRPPPSEAGVRTVPDSAAATATESTSHSHSQEIAPLLFTVEDVLRRVREQWPGPDPGLPYTGATAATATAAPMDDSDTTASDNCDSSGAANTNQHHTTTTTTTTATTTTTTPTTTTILLLLDHLREALSVGMGFGNDLDDTTIECMCAAGRRALTLVLKEHISMAMATTTTTMGSLQNDPQTTMVVDRFLDVSFEALRQAS